jgi:excisionase family DNA binding protein
MAVDAHAEAAMGHSSVDDSTDVAARAAKSAAYRVYNILREHPGAETVPLRSPDGDEDLTVPRHAAELLMRILSSMAAGKPVTVIPDHAELTTQQAADLMNVSRPHVIKLLDEQKIQFRMVGTHRRVSAVSVREYLDERMSRQRRAADELAALTHEMDLY